MRLLARQTHPARGRFLARPLAAGTPSTPPHDTIYFDASCGMCSVSAHRFQRILRRYGFAFVALQDPGVSKAIGVHPGEIPDEMKLQKRDGQTLGGADAIVHICGRIWWAWPVWAISRIPQAMRVMRTIYNKVATNRHRISKACRIDAKIF